MEKYCPKCFKKYPVTLKECPTDGTNLVSFHDQDLTGRVLDKRYTVLARIGQGGMGVVYKAEQHLIGRIVALKVLRRQVVQDENAVKRFLNEARATSSLQSPHTVSLHDFGVTDEGLLYYTMEFLQGRPLSKLIKAEAPLPYRRAVDLTLQACDSLAEAHERNILHRDIKPDNLFVISVRGRETVKVLDFGIAKLVGDTSVESLTRTGSIVGTPQYLSPEQAQGNPAVPASDLYSLAIVLYEMLAGIPPFVADTPMQTLWKHAQEQPEPIRVKNPNIEVPKSMDLFCQKALEKNPARRFQSATAFRNGLEKALADHDASPETVTLTALSDAEGGVRGRTEPVPPEPAADEAAAAVRVEAPQVTTDTAEPLDLQSAPAPSITPAEREVAQTPGPGTRGLVSAVRTRAWWVMGTLAVVLLLAGVAVWQPWVGGDSEVGMRNAEPRKGEKVASADKAGDQKRSTEEAVAARKTEEENRKAAAAEAAKQAEEERKAEEARKAAAAAAAKQAEEERKAEEARKAAQAEAARKAEEERKAQKKPEEDNEFDGMEIK